MILYTKTICPKCLFVKAELVRAGIEVEVVNIDTHPEAKDKIVEAGFTTVPVFEWNGQMTSDVKEIVQQAELLQL